MKKLAVVITTPPYSNLTITALNYIEAALHSNINIVGVFFYQDGVLNANSKVQIASDEFQTIKRWQSLHEQYHLPLHLCITAAEKRGMPDEDGTDSLIHDAFTISGLGELVELSSTTDRLVQF
ncbi:MAG: sulfurtransferase complex subunit TusD [Colwellia sp.]|nr:sulfurtransferase complex subunit TusD [Colwellia sp.]MCW9080706.1 sulfurtransferase complex subunit TusD [Colwellia sp.]